MSNTKWVFVVFKLTGCFCILYLLVCTNTQTLQSAQEQEIGQLEKMVEDKKFDHENKIRVLKAKFLEEKRLFDVAMEDHIKTMADQANMVQWSLVSSCMENP